MRKSVKITLLILASLAVFIGVGLYDASARATRLQDGAHSQLDLCKSMSEQVGRSAEACVTSFRQALDASQGLAMQAAVPIALGALVVLWVLIGLAYLLVSRRRHTGAEPAA